MSKQIPVAQSEWAYRGDGLVGPLDVLTNEGYHTDFMTTFGRKLPALPPSMQEVYLDPPLNKVVTDAHFASNTKKFHNSYLLACPINLSQLISLLQYFNGESFEVDANLKLFGVHYCQLQCMLISFLYPFEHTTPSDALHNT